MSDEITLLRHTVATLAYRAAKSRQCRRNSPISACAQSRTPCEILAHMGDLFDWALHLADGKHVWHDSPALEWSAAIGELRRSGGLRPSPCLRRAAGLRRR